MSDYEKEPEYGGPPFEGWPKWLRRFLDRQPRRPAALIIDARIAMLELRSIVAAGQWEDDGRLRQLLLRAAAPLGSTQRAVELRESAELAFFALLAPPAPDDLQEDPRVILQWSLDAIEARWHG